MQKRYHTLENIIFDAIVYLVMAFVLICCLVPFIYMLAVSFSGTKPLINGEVFLWPKDFTLDSYKQIFTSRHMAIRFYTRWAARPSRSS